MERKTTKLIENMSLGWKGESLDFCFAFAFVF
jgi:hypothetical protein